jgi:hypothetical protein
VTGNCAAQLSSVTFFIPAGCEIQVDAQMQPRIALGCSASGADMGDAIKVEGSSPKLYQMGSMNATIVDSHTQVGGEITVYCIANRADEIVTYQAYVVSGFCPDCALMLPVEFVAFNVFVSGNDMYVEWSTASEINNDYFSIEVSRTQSSWLELLKVPGAGTSSSLLHYSERVPSPGSGIIYFRIRQTDFNGEFSFSPVIGIQTSEVEPILSQHPENNSFTLSFHAEPGEYALCVFNSTGAKNYATKSEFPSGHGLFNFTVPAGLHILTLTDKRGNLVWTSKVIGQGQ